MDLDLSQLLVIDNNEETFFYENITRPTENITSTNDAPKSKHTFENSTESSDSDCDLDAEIATLTIQKQKLEKREKIRQLQLDINNLKTTTSMLDMLQERPTESQTECYSK